MGKSKIESEETPLIQKLRQESYGNVDITPTKCVSDSTLSYVHTGNVVNKLAGIGSSETARLIRN